MVDQVRSESYLRHPTTGAMRDNTAGLITPQVARDAHVSAVEFAKSKSHRFTTSSSTLAIDCSQGDTQEILLAHSITSLSFTNRRPVNLIWPNTDLQHSNWIKGADVIVTAAQADPIGTTTAHRVQITDHAAHIAFEAVAGVTYTALIWLKENGTSSINIGFATTSSSAPLAPTNIVPTGSWARYSHTWVADATATRYFVIDDGAGAVVDAIVWRPQVYASDLLPNEFYFEDIIFDTTNAPEGEATYLNLILKQDGVGSRTITWPANVLWPAGPPDPVLSTAINAIDMVSLVSPDGGARWFGVLGGKAFA